MDTSRREFVKKISQNGIATLAIPSLFSVHKSEPMASSKGLTILFQGDSITDGNRTRNQDWNHVMGHGYQCLVASRLWFDYPERGFMFYNRGISGNRVTDLEARWQKDTLDLKPDVVSILIGVNDTMAVVNNQNPESIERFEESYHNILESTKKEFPEVIFVICEPFILPLGWVSKNTEVWQTEIKKRQAIAKKLADEFNAIFIEFQKPFEDACKKAPAEYWIWDGVHPMPAGHELMARIWIKKVGKKIKL
jgi:lysophospholipase L1-like esterase